MENKKSAETIAAIESILSCNSKEELKIILNKLDAAPGVEAWPIFRDAVNDRTARAHIIKICQNKV